jgi:hypothetical protein
MFNQWILEHQTTHRNVFSGFRERTNLINEPEPKNEQFASALRRMSQRKLKGLLNNVETLQANLLLVPLWCVASE